jgi:biopolymer transport protein ExbD
MRQLGRRRGGRSAGGGHGPLALVPMIDMLTILVVYLLVHAADYEILPNTRSIAIPQSLSEVKPRESVTMLVTRDMVYVNGAAIVPLDAVRANEGNVVATLVAALRREGARDMVSGRPDRHEVTVLADRELPYSVMRRIMASASAAEFTAVSLAVVEKTRVAAAIG